MKSPRARKDPGPTVFGWDEEPALERPSEWGETTFQAPASGYHRSSSVGPALRRSRQRAGVGCAFLVGVLAVVGGGAWAAIR